jgi:RNA polymerase sigma-70 factor (ECF subfamily)
MTARWNNKSKSLGERPEAGFALTVVPLRPSSPPLTERMDDELMQLASAGVDEAFSMLVRRYQGVVRGYCARRCGNTQAGDDVAQEVFVELWRTRARYQARGRFRSYLFTIVQTRTLNAVQRYRPFEELTQDMPRPGSELDAVLEAERRRQILHQLSLLPNKLGEALLLRFFVGLEYEEMAQVLGRSQTTVRSRVFHGVKRLRNLLGEDRDP